MSAYCYATHSVSKNGKDYKVSTYQSNTWVGALYVYFFRKARKTVADVLTDSITILHPNQKTWAKST